MGLAWFILKFYLLDCFFNFLHLLGLLLIVTSLHHKNPNTVLLEWSPVHHTWRLPDPRVWLPTGLLQFSVEVCSLYLEAGFCTQIAAAWPWSLVSSCHAVVVSKSLSLLTKPGLCLPRRSSGSRRRLKPHALAILPELQEISQCLFLLLTVKILWLQNDFQELQYENLICVLSFSSSSKKIKNKNET